MAEQDKPSVLHVDPDHEVLAMTESVLNGEDAVFDFLSTTDPDEAVEFVGHRDLACVVIGYSPESSEGTSLLDRMRTRRSGSPLVLFTDDEPDEPQETVFHHVERGHSRRRVEHLAATVKYVVESTRADTNYDSLLESTREALAVYDPRTLEVVDVNEAFCDVFDFGLDDVVGESLYDVTPGGPQENLSLLEEMEDVGGDEPNRFSWEHRLESGEKLHLEIQLTPAEIDGIHRVVASFRDVTRLRRFEREAERQRHRFEAVFEDPESLVAELDSEGRVAEVNENVVAYTGYDSETLRGGELWRQPWWHDEDRDRVKDAIARARDAEYVEFGARLSTRKGSLREVEAAVRPVREETADGETVVTGIIASARDVTRRRRRKRELEQFETIVETMPMGVFVLDENATIIRGNERAASMAGYTKEELTGEHFTSLVQEGVVEKQAVEDYVDIVRRLLSSDYDETQRKIETTVRPRGGGERDIEAHVALLPYEEDYDGTVMVYHDVTEQKRKEMELERQNERLDRFASLVSHDLRNLLSVAEGQLEFAVSTEQFEPLEDVEEALETMDSMIEDLLDMSRQGSVIDDVEELNLEEVAEAAWKNVETESMDLEMAVGEVTLDGDFHRLQRVFENLYRNARDHGDASWIQVGVTNETADGVPGFYVEDDGEGIPRHMREEVFEYGVSEDGSGLGLAIVENIVNAHGWEVDVFDGEEGGARFEISGARYSWS